MTAHGVKNNCAPGEEKNSIFILQTRFQKSSHKILIYYFQTTKIQQQIPNHLFAVPGKKKKENGGGESEGSKYYVFWADHKAALKFIFSHLIEAPEDLGGIECVLWKYASRKTRKDMNSN